MNDKERNKFTMLKNVQSNNNTFLDVIKLYPKLDYHNTSLNSQIELIKQNDVVYSTVKLGTTDQKNSAKEVLAGLLYKRCRTTLAFATDINDLELKALVDESESVILRLPNEELSKKANVVLEKIKEHKLSLTEYGLGDEEINELEATIKDYDSKLGNKETKTQASHLARNDLSELFSSAEEILKQLDNIIEGLPAKHPEFYKNYMLARTVKNLGGNHSAPVDPPNGGNGNDNPPKSV